MEEIIRDRFKSSNFMMRFLDSKVKFYFGSGNAISILSGFLNTIFEGKYCITDVFLCNTERLPDVFTGKRIIYYFGCKVEGQDNYIIVRIKHFGNKLIDIHTENGIIENIDLDTSRFNKDETECLNDYEKWLFLMRYMANLYYLPFTEDKDDVFAHLRQIFRRKDLSSEEYSVFEDKWKNYNDYYNTLEYAFEEGYSKM